MLHFLENHDEQRIASPEFAGNAEKAKPAMLVSACLSSAPTMIYFGQEVGEPGAENAGFGQSSRTSIFDYIGVPHHQRWMNHGQFDGALLSQSEQSLRSFYQTLLSLTLSEFALTGQYHDLYAANYDNFADMQHQLYAFARSDKQQKLIVATNFSDTYSKDLDLIIPPALIQDWQLSDGEYALLDKLNGRHHTLRVINQQGLIALNFDPLASLFLCLG
jgi:glycosidase